MHKLVTFPHIGTGHRDCETGVHAQGVMISVALLCWQALQIVPVSDSSASPRVLSGECFVLAIPLVLLLGAYSSRWWILEQLETSCGHFAEKKWTMKDLQCMRSVAAVWVWRGNGIGRQTHRLQKRPVSNLRQLRTAPNAASNTAGCSWWVGGRRGIGRTWGIRGSWGVRGNWRWKMSRAVSANHWPSLGLSSLKRPYFRVRLNNPSWPAIREVKCTNYSDTEAFRVQSVQEERWCGGTGRTDRSGSESTALNRIKFQWVLAEV